MSICNTEGSSSAEVVTQKTADGAPFVLYDVNLWSAEDMQDIGQQFSMTTHLSPRMAKLAQIDTAATKWIAVSKWKKPSRTQTWTLPAIVLPNYMMSS